MDNYWPRFERINSVLRVMTDMEDPTDIKTKTITFITMDSEKRDDSKRFAPTIEQINDMINHCGSFTGLDRKKIKIFAREIERSQNIIEHHLVLFYSED